MSPLLSTIAQLLVAVVLVWPQVRAAPGLLGAKLVPAELKTEEPYDTPHYHFSYGVQDLHSGDIKSQSESRDGHVVTGQYSLVEPDGSIRTVKYTADEHNGFNAVVSKSGPGVHAVPAKPTFVPAKPVLTKIPLHHARIAAPVILKPTMTQAILQPSPVLQSTFQNYPLAIPTARPSTFLPNTTPSIQQQLLALYPQPTLLPLPALEQPLPAGASRPQTPFRYPQGSSGSQPASTGPIQFPDTPEEDTTQPPQLNQNQNNNFNYENQKPTYQAPNYQTPNYQNPIYQTPNYQSPNYQSPNYESPNSQSPNSQNSNSQNSNSQNSNSQNSNSQNPIYQAPKYLAPTYKSSDYQIPNYQSPKFQSPSLQASNSQFSNFQTNDFQNSNFPFSRPQQQSGPY